MSGIKLGRRVIQEQQGNETDRLFQEMQLSHGQRGSHQFLLAS